jgi:hypothetical protein
MTTLTGYKVAKLANAALTEKGFAPIKPQMVYNYINNNLIPSVDVNGQKLVPADAATAWVAKFVARRTERIAESEVPAIEDLEGMQVVA